MFISSTLKVLQGYMAYSCISILQCNFWCRPKCLPLSESSQIKSFYTKDVIILSIGGTQDTVMEVDVVFDSLSFTKCKRLFLYVKISSVY